MPAKSTSSRSSVVSSIASKFKKAVPSFRKKKESKPSAAEAVKHSYLNRNPAQVQELATNKRDHMEQVKELDEAEEVNAVVTQAPLFSPPVVKTGPAALKEQQLTNAIKPTNFSGMGSKLNPYLILWNRNEDNGLEASRDLAYNHYVPNAISIFETLDRAHRVMAFNDYLKKTDFGYLPLAVNLYISIVFYLRILQVRQVYGVNSPTDSRTLVRFERVRKLADLPIPILLRPHFESICAYQPDDPRLNTLLPFIPSNIGGDAGTDIHSTTSIIQDGARPLASFHGYSALLGLPLPPILRDWMRYYISADLDEKFERVAAIQGNNPVPAETALVYNYKDSFVPFEMGRHTARTNAQGGSKTLAGYTVNQVTDADAAEATWYMNALGVDKTSGFEFQRFKDYQNFWKSSRYASLAPAVTRTTEDLSNLESFLGFTDNLDWFGDLVSQVTIFSKYMGGAVSLSTLPQTGFGSIAVFNDAIINSATMQPNHRITNPRFHRTRILNVRTTQRVYETDLPARETYLARALLTNARFKWYRSQNGAAPDEAAHGMYFTNQHHTRIGPYFGNKIVNATKENAGPFSTLTCSSTSPVVALDGIEQDIREHFYVPKPN